MAGIESATDTVTYFFGFVTMPNFGRPASAALNSFPTDWGTPTFLANAGLCATAAINRR